MSHPQETTETQLKQTTKAKVATFRTLISFQLCTVLECAYCICIHVI